MIHVITSNGCILLSIRETRTAYSIIAREMAPGAADENMFVPDDKSSTLGLIHDNMA